MAARQASRRLIAASERPFFLSPPLVGGGMNGSSTFPRKAHNSPQLISNAPDRPDLIDQIPARIVKDFCRRRSSKVIKVVVSEDVYRG